MQFQHPWQRHPAELVSHALEHFHRPTDRDQRIAFLLLDVGVETILKTYLLLPEGIIGKDKPTYSNRRQAVNSEKFHLVVEKAWETATEQVREIESSHVLYYHNIRNKLYHQGDGVVVTNQNTEAYAQLAVQLLRRLLEVDLEPELLRPQLELKKAESAESLVEEIHSVQIRLRQQLDGIDRLARIALEMIDPDSLMVDAEAMEAAKERGPFRQDPELTEILATAYLNHDGELLAPIPDWLNKAMAEDELKWISEPIPPRRVRWKRLTRIASEFGLSCAETDSNDIFGRAERLAWTDPRGDLSSWMASDEEDPLTKFRDICEEALGDLESTHAAIFEGVLDLKTRSAHASQEM